MGAMPFVRCICMYPWCICIRSGIYDLPLVWCFIENAHYNHVCCKLPHLLHTWRTLHGRIPCHQYSRLSHPIQYDLKMAFQKMFRTLDRNIFRDRERERAGRSDTHYIEKWIYLLAIHTSLYTLQNKWRSGEAECTPALLLLIYFFCSMCICCWETSLCHSLSLLLD